ncbi:MAG TPA: protein kinase [Planctomycetaceae bacterium]|nr:protein kinase [Planctomycetaceae bacterium]
MTHTANVKTASAPPRDLAAIVDEYAAVWRLTLDSLELPRPDSYLDVVDDDSQPELRALLARVDEQFRRKLVSAEADGTIPNWRDPTLIVPPAPPEAKAPAAAPGDGHDRHEPTVIAPRGAESIGATASFADVEVRVSTKVKTGGEHQPPTDDARHAPTVIGNVEPDDSGAQDMSWNRELSPAVGGDGRRPALPNVPGYEILGVLGRGGMGVVYRARQTGLNRVVALKMILAGDHAAPEHVARFKIEAEAVAQLQHPNITQIFDIGSAGGLPYFSLEFVDGRSLEAERDGKPLPPDQAARMVVSLARAMHYAHQRGIVHRDLKPANVLLTSDGVPKVTDFGLVKRVEADSSETRTGTIVGTPSYMAPEQAWGRTDIGPLADVYALGAILYTLLTGRPPFLGTTPLETIMQLRQQEPLPPSRLQPGLSRDLETICLKALQKSPQSRYVDASALADDLERFLDGAPILARPVGRPERTWRWCRRNPALAVSGGVALALAVCLMIGGPAAAAMIYHEKQQAVAARQKADDNADRADENARRANTNADLAKRNEREALANLELARQNEKRARESQQLAARNAETARQQRDLSIDALNTLAERAQDDLKDLPQTQEIRRKLLLTAMSGLDRVADTGAGDEKRDLVLARAHGKMGNILLETGLAEQARDQFEKSHRAVLELMRASDPAKPHVPHLNLARSYVNLGKATQRMGDAPAAKGYFLVSLKEREQALSVYPEGADVKPDRLFIEQEIADSYQHLISISAALGRPADALDYQRRGMELRQKWLERTPGNVAARREFAGAQLALATASLDLGRLPEAIEQYADALKTLEKVAEAEPRAISSRGNIAYAHNQLGAAWLFAEESAKSRAEYAQAVELFEQLVAEDPESAIVQRKLGTACYGLGVACLESGEADDARRHFARCAEVRRALAGKDPDDRTLQADLMLALARTGDHAEAARLARDLEQHAATDASLLYFVAGGYALASQTASADEALAGQYATTAIAALKQAIEHGYRGLPLIRMDPDLDPIRDQPGFQQVVAGLELTLASTADRPPESATTAP